jgi:hypothetical protein
MRDTTFFGISHNYKRQTPGKITQCLTHGFTTHKQNAKYKKRHVMYRNLTINQFIL